MSKKRERVGNDGMEENIMAILDTVGFANSAQHIADDRQSFLGAVRSGFLDNAYAPTSQIYEAIFQILKDETSLDLIMSSYQLLLHLDMHFPQAWSPFSFDTDVTSNEKQEDDGKISGTIDITEFHHLIEDLSKVPDEANKETLNTEPLRDMLLFQYLVNVLEGDLVPRNLAITEKSDWVSLRESLLNMILVSRKITYKGLVKDCLSAMCELSQFSMDRNHDMTPAETGSTEKSHTALALALPEVVNRTCAAVQKFLFMIIELDSCKKVADLEGWTTRADGTRTPAIEIILDELAYDKNILIPFFKALDKPQLKLDMIVQYLQKYIPKTSGRTRRSKSNGSSTDDSTFGGVLGGISNGNNIKPIINKISSEVAQLLLAHAFQAYILLPSLHSTESKEDNANNSLPSICNNMISVFTCIEKADKSTGILPFGKEALFTAAIMLSRN